MKTLTLRLFVLGAVAMQSACSIKPAQPLPPPPAAVIDTFTVTPDTVAQPGDMVTLTWVTSNATSVSVDQVGVGPVSTTATVGSVTVPVERTTIFLVTARGEGGTDAVSRAVTVGQGATDLLFAALPSRLTAGQSATLTWFAPGAQTVTLTEVGGAAVDLGTQLQTGTVTVKPAKSTSWKLVADGREATVSVVVKPLIAEFALATAAPLPGGTLKLTWKTAGADSLVLKRLGSATPLLMELDAAAIAQGEYIDTAPAELSVNGRLDYQLEVTAGATTVRAPLAVHLAGALRIRSFETPLFVKPNGDLPVSWQTQAGASVRVLVDEQEQYQSSTQANTNEGSTTVRAGTADLKVTLVARSASGGEVRQDRTVGIVGAVGTPTLTATPNTLPSGGAPVTLTWSAPGARRVVVLENGLLAVAQLTGLTAENGMVQVWPNTSTTTYELLADNTIDAALSARTTVAVATPITMANADGGTVFTNQGAIDLTWLADGGVAASDGGTEVVGFPALQPEVASTGFDDISLTGASINFSDPDSANASFATDFETVLGGRRVASPVVTVNTNGVLALGPSLSASDTVTSTWPSSSYEANLIAPYWADLDMVETAHWQVKGTAPNRVLIVQWTHAQRYFYPLSDLTFQAKIYQSGQVDFEYAKFDLAGSSGVFLAGLSTSRGVGASSSTVAPQSFTRRSFFGPLAAAANFSAAIFTVVPVRGYARMPGGGLMQLGYADEVRPEELAISEVMYAPVAPYADAGEWFEVVNRSPRAIDLTGWTIEFGTLADGGLNRHTISQPVIVPSGSVRVFGQSADAGDNGSAPVDYEYGAGFELPDVAGTVALSRGPVRVAATWTTTMADAGSSAIFDPNPVIRAGTGALGPKTCRPPTATTYGAQIGSPGRDTTCLGYRMQRVDLKWRDIASTGAPIAFTNALGTLDLTAAPLTLWGAPVTSLTVSRSGWLLPGAFSGTNVTANKSRPSATSPAGTIAPFWDDLVIRPRPGSGVFAQRFAAGDDVETPSAHWIVQWAHVAHSSSSSDDLNFEVKFFDSGAVEYHYGSMESASSSVYGGGGSATMWFELPDASAAIAAGINTTVLRPTNTLAWRFSPLAP